MNKRIVLAVFLAAFLSSSMFGTLFIVPACANDSSGGRENPSGLASFQGSLLCDISEDLDFDGNASEEEDPKPYSVYGDKWSFNNAEKWSGFAKSDNDSAEVVIGVNNENPSSLADIKDLIDENGGELVDTFSTEGEVRAVVADIPLETLSFFVRDTRTAGFSRYVEPNMKVQACLVPNDPYWSQQWGPAKIEADYAWNATVGDSSVLVAVIDTGIDWNHPDLAANYVPLGWDWVNYDPDPMDDNGHGTHCAGIIAAVINNSVGIAGLAQVQIMAEKALDSSGEGYSYDIANAIAAAVYQGADILANSWGDYYSSMVIYDAVQYAYKNDVLVVAAAGNDATSSKVYPAAYDEVIAVTATDQFDNPSSWPDGRGTNFGNWVEVAAPGTNIYSTVSEVHDPYFTANYGYANGTSMACPCVAGVAALILSQFPNMTRDQLRLQLRYTAEDLGPPEFDEYYGYGRVNARRAVEEAPPDHDLVVIDLEIPAAVKPGNTITANTTIFNFGLTNENNITLQLLVNGSVANSTSIGFLSSGTSATVSLTSTPIIEGTCNVTSYVVPVPGETVTWNNALSEYILVRGPKVFRVPEDYPTIQEAVNAAFSGGGDTVKVAPGTYYEHVVVNNPVSLVGENPATTIIDGGGETGVKITAPEVYVINLTIRNGYYGIWISSSSSDNVISGSNVKANNEYGVYIQKSSNNVIDGSIVTKNDAGGIVLAGSSNNTISANNVTDNGYWTDDYGIDLTYCSIWEGCWPTSYSDNNTIIGNNITRNTSGIRLCASWYNTLIANTVTNNSRNGIHLETSSQNTLRDNNIAGNQYDFGVFTFYDEVRLSTYTQDIDISNTVNGKPLNYLVNQKGLIINSFGIGYLALVNCTDITVRNLSITNNGQGLLLAFTTNSTIENVTIADNRVGIHILSSDANTITANNMTNNRYGVNSYRASFNNITENTLINNGVSVGSLVFGWGVLFTTRNIPSEDNIISSNSMSGGGISLSGPGTTRTLVDGNNITKGGINTDWLTSNNTLTGNNITNSDYGIVLDCSFNNILRNNNMANNRYNFEVRGGSVSDFVNDVDVSNAVDGKPMYYWIGKWDEVIPADAGYVALVNSYNVTVKGLQLKNNGQGVLLVNTTNSQITNNNVTNNSDGIGLLVSSNNILSDNNLMNNYLGVWLASSSNNTLAGNTITDSDYCGIGLVDSSNNNTLTCNSLMNTLFGIGVLDSSYNAFFGNEIANNHYGIDLVRSSNNFIYHNNFLCNTAQTYIEYSDYSNSWDNGYPSGGNHWSDHICTGNPSDGSQPYVIDADNVDHYPFQDPNGWINTLTIYSSPSGVEFAVDGVSHIAPWSGTYSEGTLVSLVMPETHDGYVWSHWLEDGNPNRTKTVTLDTNITLTGVFALLSDLDGDGFVGISDISVAALAFGSFPEHPRWNPVADLNKDGWVDIGDIAKIAVNFGKTV